MTTSTKARDLPLSPADEIALAERLIAFDSSHDEGIRACSGFVGGWLDARSIPYTTIDLEGLSLLSAQVGEGPVTVVLHAHYDVVPGSAKQFMPWRDGEYLWGRGAYDMKGATAAMLCVMADLAPFADALGIKVRMLLVPDEETDAVKDVRGTELLVQRGHVGDFVICGEPTDMQVGVQAKGVLDVRVDVQGVAAHGATPWLGVNAITRAMDVYDQLLMLPFASATSRFFDRPSINLGRIRGGDRINQVPDSCTLDVDIRYLPEQPIDGIRDQLQTLAGCTVSEISCRPPAKVSTSNEFLRLLRGAGAHETGSEPVCVGRDGTNDGTFFLQRGIPSVEFGPVGAGHHGPEERVSLASLADYRRTLLRFVLEVGHEATRLTGLTVPTRTVGGQEERPSLL